jgi:hypothetical protein
MDDQRVKPLTLAQLAKAVRAPLNTTLRCLYDLAAQERWVDRWAIINPGCTVQEIDSAEQRVGVRFHQLHRLLLTLSNGGSIPFVTSVSLFAAAIARETEWRVVGPFLTAAERGAGLFITARQVQAIYPKIIGYPVDYPSESAQRSSSGRDDDLVFIASGFGGEEWGYVRGRTHQVGCVVHDRGRLNVSLPFENWLGGQRLLERCSTPEFQHSLHELTSALE